jgi:hypothetical protein
MNFVCCNDGKNGEKHLETCEYGLNPQTREQTDDRVGPHPTAVSPETESGDPKGHSTPQPPAPEPAKPSGEIEEPVECWAAAPEQPMRAATSQENRVTDYLWDLNKGEIGAGDDPVGFLIASHASLHHEIAALRKELDQYDLQIRSALGDDVELAEGTRSSCFNRVRNLRRNAERMEREIATLKEENERLRNAR